jgi:thiol-disulfide isomerase/thioredoxin
LLAKEVVRRYQGKVAFVSENYGESELAQRFGLTRYPVIFVGDVLVARPRDFGFFATGENSGRYTPFRDAKNHAKFQQDLVRMIDLVLSGQKEALRAERAEDAGAGEIAALPQFALTDLDGRPLTREEAAGRVVVVEFWATWCPPCHSTLKWLGEVKKKHGDRVAVLALAVESQDADVRKMAGEYSREVRWAIGTPEVAQAFGDVVSVPTLFVFDRNGKTASVFYGAPADLHQKAGQLIESLVR